MKLTSAKANKLLKKLNEEFSSLTATEQESATFLAAVGEDPESVRPAYSYSDVQRQLQDLERQIRTLKHAINRFNLNTTVEGFDMSVDQLLIYIPQLTKRKQKLSTMKDRIPKTRSGDSFGSNIIDYRYTNYDIDEVKKDFDAVSDELSRAQVALDTLNNSLEFDVEL